MPRVGDRVWRLNNEYGKWEGGYEVTAVHTGNRTMDLKDEDEDNEEVKGVARDDVLIDAAEAADKRAEIVAYVAAHDLGATLGAVFANDEDEGDDIMDPRTCTHLDLRYKDLSAAGAMPPAAAWQRLPELKKVYLMGATLPANGLEDVFAGCAHLADLYLRSAKFDQCEGGGPAVVDQLAAAPIGTERPLDLHLCGVTALRAGDVFSRLIAGCPRLRVLDVPCCGLEALPEELGTACRELEELYAGGNKLVGALPASLGTLPKLRVLNLWNNAGLTALPPAIAQLAQLDGTVDHGDGKRHYLALIGCTGLVAPP